MSTLGVVATAIWVMLPAYVPNNVAVLVGGGPPIDGGRTWRGARVLGDGKTWRGATGGWVAGVVLALGLSQVAPVLGNAVGLDLPTFPLPAALNLPLGAVIGDVAASFLKRRVGRTRGAPVPVLDQLDFVAGALFLALLTAPAWFAATVTGPVLVAVVLVTPVLHVGTNAIAYGLGLKDEPW